MTPSRPPLYADENVDGGLVRALRRLDWDVLRALDAHPPATGDEVHFEDAASRRRVLMTSDVDMLGIASRWLREERPFTGVVFYHADRPRTVGSLLRALAAAMEVIEDDPAGGWVRFLASRETSG